MPDRLRAIFDTPERVLGFRGTALILFSLMFIGIGVGVPHQTPREGPLYDESLSVEFRVGFWLLCAAVGLLAAVVQRPKWQSRGFLALMLPPGERFTSFLGGTIWDDAGHIQWLPGTCIYFLICTLLLLIAAWPEPVDTPPPYLAQEVNRGGPPAARD